MAKSRTLILHPWLLTCYPILFLFARNMAELTPQALIAPTVVSLVIAVLLYVGLRTAVGSSAKAGVLVSIVSVMFFSYGHCQELLKVLLPNASTIARHRVFLPAWGGVTVLLILAAVRTRSDLLGLTRSMNLGSCALLTASLVSIGAQQFGTEGLVATRRDWNQFVEKQCEVLPPLRIPSGQQAPDIYHIVLDEYGRSDALSATLGIDNRPFLRGLEDRGFYVAEKGRSNYRTTYSSIASVLNMGNLEDLATRARIKQRASFGLPGSMIRTGIAPEMLKRAGYRYIFISSGWQVTAENPRADEVKAAYAMTEFDRMLLDRSVLRVWQRPLLGSYRKHVEFAMDQLSKIPEDGQPTYVFAHICSPHRPFVFDADGRMPPNPLPPDGVTEAEHYRRMYPGQVAYLDRRIRQVVATILKHSKTPPVILIHGDHGVDMWVDKGFRSNREPTAAQRALRREILMACYLPQARASGATSPRNAEAYATISPANLLRVVFNRYFGADYPLLRDGAWRSIVNRHPSAARDSGLKAGDEGPQSGASPQERKP